MQTKEYTTLYAPFSNKLTILSDYSQAERPGVNHNQIEAARIACETIIHAESERIGAVIVILGAMGGGKTTTLGMIEETLRIREFGAKVLKHAFDSQRNDEEKLVSHAGQTWTDAILYHAMAEIPESEEILIVDEFQFISGTPVDIQEFLDTRKNHGQHTVIGMLDFDFRREPWAIAIAVCKEADRIIVVQPRCISCKARPAEFTERRVNGQPAHVDDPVIVVGAEEMYLAACGFCHQVGGKKSAIYE